MGLVFLFYLNCVQNEMAGCFLEKPFENETMSEMSDFLSFGMLAGKFQPSRELMSPPAAVSTTEAVRSTFFLDPCVGAASAGGTSSLLSEAFFLLSAWSLHSLGRSDVPRVQQSQARLNGAESLGTHATQHSSALATQLKSTFRRRKLSEAGRPHYAVNYVSR